MIISHLDEKLTNYNKESEKQDKAVQTEDRNENYDSENHFEFAQELCNNSLNHSNSIDSILVECANVHECKECKLKKKFIQSLESNKSEYVRVIENLHEENSKVIKT